jgi:hypothetical protein
MLHESQLFSFYINLKELTIFVHCHYKKRLNATCYDTQEPLGSVIMKLIIINDITK